MASTAPTNNISGIISGFDWKTFIQQTIQYESAPQTQMQTEQTQNTAKISALNSIQTSMQSLQDSVATLQVSDTFSGTIATVAAAGGSSVANVTASSSPGTATGAYTINVTQLATASTLKGANDIGAGLSSSGTVSGLTLATLPTATAVTAGTFTVNGQQVTIALSDSLQDVFDKISTATGGVVTASYDPATDHIALASAAPIILGAANDTSNFLTVAQLRNNGTGAISSASALGSVQVNTALTGANLTSAVTAVDGSGNGSFTINGVSISYNVNTDTINSVLNKINSSTAGVAATFDRNQDRIILTNETTGNTGINVSESAGGLLGALGLTGSSPALSLGKDANYSINGGPTLISQSNTFGSDSHGVAGLSVTATATGSSTVTVAADTASMTTAINTFISAYNASVSLINSQTLITSANGKVTTSTLSGNSDVESWAASLRDNAFNSVSGLTGVVKQLADLGIDFTPGTSQLAIVNQTQLTNALTNNPSDVLAFFSQGTTSFASRMTTYINSVANSTGYISQDVATLTQQNSSLTTQIATFQTYLDSEQAKLTAAFTAMEAASQTQQNLQAQLTSAFGNNSTKTTL